MLDNVEKIEACAYENEYKIVKTKKRSIINVFLINVGICLAVSLALLVTRLVGGSEVIETFVQSVA